MSNTNRSLYGLMRINKHIIIDSKLPTKPIVPRSYILSDFGENAINNHSPYDAWHSEKNQVIFNYITKNFRDRCISFQSYNTDVINDAMVYSSKVLQYSRLLYADIIYTPYVAASYWMNSDYFNFVLSINSHFDNNGQGLEGNEGNRHDVTPNANTFFKNSIGVSARRDTPELFKGYTSFGYGMEFFQDCSKEALDTEYPDKDIPMEIAEVISNNGTDISSMVHWDFTKYLTIGQKITIKRSSDESTWQDTFITDIIGSNYIKVYPAITPIISSGISGIYLWCNGTLGDFVGGQAESWAVPIVAGKLKVIKMTTGANWDTVRAAARATAKRNTTGIEEIDNVNWDIYRGFGCIDIQAAIEFINTNN